jgi:hypothetical protein
MAEPGWLIETRRQSAMESLQRRAHDRPAVLAVDDRNRDRVALPIGGFGEQRPVREGAFQRKGARGAAGTRWRRPCLEGHLFPAGVLTRQELDHGLTDTVQIRAEPLKDLGPYALALADQPEQDVLGPDVVMAQLHRLAESQLEDLLGTRREGDVTGHGRLASSDDLRDLLTGSLEGDVHHLERLRGDALSFMAQGEQDVLGPDVVVAKHPRFFLGEDDNPPGSVGESLEQGSAQLTPVMEEVRGA